METDGTTPVPNLDLHRMIIRRKMTELKERLKSTDKVLNDTLLILDQASLRIEDEEREITEVQVEFNEREAKRAQSSQTSQPETNRKWSMATIYLN